MIEFIRPAYRPASVRPHPRAATVMTAPVGFGDTPAEPENSLVFEHGPHLSPEDIMVLAQEGAIAPAPDGHGPPAGHEKDDVPAPYLDDFMQGLHANGEQFDSRE